MLRSLRLVPPYAVVFGFLKAKKLSLLSGLNQQIGASSNDIALIDAATSYLNPGEMDTGQVANALCSINGKRGQPIATSSYLLFKRRIL